MGPKESRDSQASRALFQLISQGQRTGSPSGKTGTAGVEVRRIDTTEP